MSLLTVAELAALLRVSERTVYRQAGRALPAPVRVGGQLRFRTADVEAMLG